MLRGTDTSENSSIIHVDFNTGVEKDPALDGAIARMRQAHHKNWLALLVGDAVQNCIGKPLNGCARSLDVLMKKIGAGASHFLGSIGRDHENHKNSSGGTSWIEGIADFLASLHRK